MEKTTHRQYSAWSDYLDRKESEPDLHDYYLMQIAQEVRRVLKKNPEKIKIKDFILKLVKGKDKTSKSSIQDVEHATAQAKLMFGVGLGFGSNIRNSKDL